MITNYNKSEFKPDSPQDFLSLYRNQVAGQWLTDPEKLKDKSNSELIDQFNESTEGKRLEALIELSRRNDPELQPFFEEIITNTSTDQERVLAMIGLGLVAEAETRRIIITTLKSTDDPLLISVGINLLEFFDVGEAADLLLDFLAHEEDQIKFHVSRALSHVEDIDNQWLADELDQLLEEEALTSSLKYFLILIIKERPLPEATPVLEKLLEDDSFGVFAIEGLGELKTDHAYELVVPYLDSEDPIHQYYAAEALGKIGDERCWDKLKKLSDKSSDPRVRYYSTWALANINRERSIEILLERLQDDDPDVRGFASDKLVEFGDVVLEPYREALEAEEREGVQEALYVLGEIGDSRVIPDLLDKAYTVDKEIEHFALEALHKVATRNNEARRQLLDVLPEADPELKVNIIRTLSGLGNPELCAYLSRYLKADNTKLRYYIVGVCGGRECPNSLHLLRRLCRDDSLSVAAYAASTLTVMKSSQAHKLALRLAREEIRPLVLIAYLRGFYLNPSPEYEEIVVKILDETEDKAVRFHAAAALKTINQDRLVKYAEKDEYLQNILDRIQVSKNE